MRSSLLALCLLCCALLCASCRAVESAPVRVDATAGDAAEPECDPIARCPERRPVAEFEQLDDWPTLRALIERPAAEIDLAELNARIAHALDPSVDVRAVLYHVEHITQLVRQSLPSRCDDRCKIAALNRVLFRELGFSSEFDPSGLYNNIDRDLLDTILQSRIGYCEGLTFLYLAIGKRLGLPLAGVAGRQHLYVRYVGAQGPIDIDTTRSGMAPARDESRCEASHGVYGVALDARAMAGRMLAVVAIASGFSSRAWLEAALALSPEAPEIHQNLATELARHGDGAGSLAHYRTARMLDPCVPLYAMNEARALYASGQRAAAMALVENTERRVVSQQVFEGAFFVSLTRARFALEEGKDDEAEAWLRNAVVESDTAPVVLEAISSMRIAQGRYDDAVAAMRAAVRRDPTTRSRAGLFLALVEQGSLDEAQRILDRLEASEGRGGALDLHRAMLFAARGSTDETRAFSRRCLRDHGRACARALISLGDASRVRGERVCARRYYEAFLSCPDRASSRGMSRIEAMVRARLSSLDAPAATVASR